MFVKSKKLKAYFLIKIGFFDIIIVYKLFLEKYNMAIKKAYKENEIIIQELKKMIFYENVSVNDCELYIENLKNNIFFDINYKSVIKTKNEISVISICAEKGGYKESENSILKKIAIINSLIDNGFINETNVNNEHRYSSFIFNFVFKHTYVNTNDDLIKKIYKIGGKPQIPSYDLKNIKKNGIDEMQRMGFFALTKKLEDDYVNEFLKDYFIINRILELNEDNCNKDLLKMKLFISEFNKNSEIINNDIFLMIKQNVDGNKNLKNNDTFTSIKDILSIFFEHANYNKNSLTNYDEIMAVISYKTGFNPDIMKLLPKNENKLNANNLFFPKSIMSDKTIDDLSFYIKEQNKNNIYIFDSLKENKFFYEQILSQSHDKNGELFKIVTKIIFENLCNKFKNDGGDVFISELNKINLKNIDINNEIKVLLKEKLNSLILINDVENINFISDIMDSINEDFKSKHLTKESIKKIKSLKI